LSRFVGWQRVEFLTAVSDAANARLSVIEEEREIEADSEPGDGTLPSAPISSTGSGLWRR
jgi:hypothetical protein